MHQTSEYLAAYHSWGLSDFWIWMQVQPAILPFFWNPSSPYPSIILLPNDGTPIVSLSKLPSFRKGICTSRTLNAYKQQQLNLYPFIHFFSFKRGPQNFTPTHPIVFYPNTYFHLIHGTVIKEAQAKQKYGRMQTCRNWYQNFPWQITFYYLNFPLLKWIIIQRCTGTVNTPELKLVSLNKPLEQKSWREKNLPYFILLLHLLPIFLNFIYNPILSFFFSPPHYISFRQIGWHHGLQLHHLQRHKEYLPSSFFLSYF